MGTESFNVSRVKWLVNNFNNFDHSGNPTENARFFYIGTSIFGAEAERSYLFLFAI